MLHSTLLHVVEPTGLSNFRTSEEEPMGGSLFYHSIVVHFRGKDLNVFGAKYCRNVGNLLLHVQASDSKKIKESFHS